MNEILRILRRFCSCSLVWEVWKFDNVILAGAVMSRLIMGAVCDLIGPRYGSAFLIMIVAPAVFAMAVVNDAAGFLMCRFFIGFSLATFVSCEYWVSSMFSTRIVGTANGIAAGWGNLGGGATQIIMPLLFAFIRDRYVFAFPDNIISKVLRSPIDKLAT